LSGSSYGADTDFRARGEATASINIQTNPARHVIVSFHRGTIKRGALARILRDLGISVDEFLALL